MLAIESKIGSVFSKVLLVCGLVMLCFVTYYSYQSTTPYYASKLWLVANILFMMIIIGIGSFIVSRYLTSKQYLILLVILGAAVRVWWIFHIKTMPTSDFGVMYDGAVKAANGDFSFTSSSYYQTWGYQLGFTLYEALIIKLFGSHLVVLKLFNILFSLGTSIIIYQLGKKGINETSGRIAALLYTFYIPNIIICSLLTNQIISTFLFFAALYILYTRNLSKYSWVFVGFLLCLGNLMRPEGSFFLLGISVFIFIYKIFPLKKKVSFNYIIKVIGIFIVYLLVQLLVNTAVVHTGIMDKGLSNNDPYWKFVVGLNYDSKGQYNDNDAMYVGKFKLGKDRNKAELALIKERVKDKKKVIELFRNKFEIFWGGGDASIFWTMWQVDKPNLNQFLSKFERLMYISFCLFALGMAALFRKNNTLVSFLLILIFGYAAVHELVEIQSRYRFDILPALFILVGYGVAITNSFLHNKLTRKQAKSPQGFWP